MTHLVEVPEVRDARSDQVMAVAKSSAADSERLSEQRLRSIELAVLQKLCGLDQLSGALGSLAPRKSSDGRQPLIEQRHRTLGVSRSMERLSQRPQRIQSLRIIVARQSPASI